jgi:hypothetical protein
MRQYSVLTYVDMGHVAFPENDFAIETSHLCVFSSTIANKLNDAQIF